MARTGRRRLTLAALLLTATLILVPAAVSAKGPSPVSTDVDHDKPSKECPDCVGASATVVIDPMGDNCNDCPIYSIHAGAGHGNGAVHAEAAVCYAAFFAFCVVDEEVHRQL